MEEKKIIYIDKLERLDGEVDFSKLSKEDLIQLATRYANDFATYLKNIVLFQAQQTEMLKWLCENNGIDVNAKRKKTAKLLKEKMAQTEKETKEKIEKVVKN